MPRRPNNMPRRSSRHQEEPKRFEKRPSDPPKSFKNNGGLFVFAYRPFRYKLLLGVPMWAKIGPRKLPRWISERSYGAKLPNLRPPWLQFGLSRLQLGLQKLSKSRSGDIPRPSKHQKDRQKALRPPNMEHFGTILDMIFQVFGTVSKIQGPAAEASAFRYKVYTYHISYMYILYTYI